MGGFFVGMVMWVLLGRVFEVEVVMWRLLSGGCSCGGCYVGAVKSRLIRGAGYRVVVPVAVVMGKGDRGGWCLGGCVGQEF